MNKYEHLDIFDRKSKVKTQVNMIIKTRNLSFIMFRKWFKNNCSY